MFPKVMFADMIQQKNLKRTVTDHPCPKLHVFQASRCFHIQSNRDKANQAAHIKDEKGAGGEGGGAWLMMHDAWKNLRLKHQIIFRY